jgi:hypothetical protein
MEGQKTRPSNDRAEDRNQYLNQLQSSPAIKLYFHALVGGHRCVIFTLYCLSINDFIGFLLHNEIAQIIFTTL